MANVSEALKARLSAKGKKRILALDGGGIRGAVTIGFLAQIEKKLADRHTHLMPAGDFRLHHYFDLIGGTSTGAIIATLLATGRSAADIKKLYKSLGDQIFSDRNGLNILGKRLYINNKYDSQPLKDELKNVFKDDVLGDESNKTGLCIVTKRLDTCSTWPVTNNPAAKFFDQNRFFLRDIVRASTAAPSYFEPEVIDVGGGEEGVFVDGGLSLANNPSMQLFLAATLKGFNLNWETGQDNMLIVSIGTGRRDKKLIGRKWSNPTLIDIAQFAPDQLMRDASEHVELMMALAGKATGPMRQIDMEIGDLSNDAFNNGKAFSYIRYNVDMDKDVLDKIGVTGLSETKVSNLMEMDLSENVDLLMKIGEAAADKYVADAHLPAIFDKQNL